MSQIPQMSFFKKRSNKMKKAAKYFKEVIAITPANEKFKVAVQGKKAHSLCGFHLLSVQRSCL